MDTKCYEIIYVNIKGERITANIKVDYWDNQYDDNIELINGIIALGDVKEVKHIEDNGFDDEWEVK